MTVNTVSADALPIRVPPGHHSLLTHHRDFYEHMALCLSRHGAREDYDCKSRGENWQLSAEAQQRPWDPPLSAVGITMGVAMGSGLRQHLARLGQPPVTRIVSSPFTRCLQTASAAAPELGISAIAVEPGLGEGMLEHWYRSWAVPGADSTWGGPLHARVGEPLPAGTVLHEAAHVPAHTLLYGAPEAAAALIAKGVTDVTVDTTYEPFAQPPEYEWASFEDEEALAARMESTMQALARKWPGESILAVSHGGPCGHAHQRLLADKAAEAPVAGYTALYVFVRAHEGAAWEAPVVADTSHLS